MKTLVVGCDASGKSTMLEGIRDSWGDQVGESTRSREASTFRQANHERVIDAEYINLREHLYLGLSHTALITMQQEKNIVTSDSSLVTRVSHSTMRRIITEDSLSDEEIINEWKSDEARAGATSPDLFVLTHAPFQTIRDRMVQRQESGDKLEHFWGFNSPLFLEAYQERWKDIIQNLSNTSYNCLMLDTSVMSPEDCMEEYNSMRKEIA